MLHHHSLLTRRNHHDGDMEEEPSGKKLIDGDTKHTKRNPKRSGTESFRQGVRRNIEH
jgi:hypothetical protein